MGIIIREASMIDSVSIAKLSGQLGYPPDEELIAKRLSVLLHNQDNGVWIASIEKEVVGWVHGFYTRRIESDAFAEIGGLVVDSAHRQKGIGKLLVQEVCTWAATKGCPKLRVRCNEKRKDTHQFYQQIGFETAKNQKVFDKKL